MQYSMTPKDVAELHMILLAMPVPPIPLHIRVDYSELISKDERLAFEVALQPLGCLQQAQTTTINSHSLIGALMIFNRALNNKSHIKSQQTDALLSKEKVVLHLIEDALMLGEKTDNIVGEDDAYSIFVRFTL